MTVIKGGESAAGPAIPIAPHPAALRPERDPDAGRGPWLQTYSGRRFFLLDPRPDEVSLQDIAHSLSLQCRFGGHCPRFYSVAEHSVLASLAAPPRLALPMLMHDAAEAYCGDVVRPLKHALAEFDRLERLILDAILTALDLGNPWPGVEPFDGMHVKAIDERMLATEARELFGLDARRAWGVEARPCAFPLHCWAPEEAERQFLARFEALRSSAALAPPPPRVPYTELREGV